MQRARGRFLTFFDNDAAIHTTFFFRRTRIHTCVMQHGTTREGAEEGDGARAGRRRRRRVKACGPVEIGGGRGGGRPA